MVACRLHASRACKRCPLFCFFIDANGCTLAAARATIYHHPIHTGGAAMQPKTRAVIALDALGLAALAALFVLWCARTPGLSVPGGIAAGCSAALFAAVGLRFVPAWVRFWQREDAAPAVPAQEPEHMAARIFCRAARARSRPAPAHVGRPRPRRAAGGDHAGTRILALPRQPALSRHRARRLYLRRRARPRRAARVSAGLPACGARGDAARPVGHLRGAADIGRVLCRRGVRGLPAAAARPAAPRRRARAAVSRARTGQLFSSPRP